MIESEVLPPSTPARNPGIDLLRGLSIVLVVLHHVGLRIPIKACALAGILPRWFLDALVWNGTEAVFIFFVLSGFLITSNALTRWGRLGAIQVRAFYARRAARILPCLVVLVAVLSLLHLAGAKDYAIARHGQSLLRTVLSALTLHLNWYEGRTGYLPGNWDVLWSLSIEEVFYLAFPMVCLLLRRDRILMPALALFALTLPFTRAALAGNPIWQEKAYLPGMAAIAAGVFGALVAHHVRPRRWILTVLAALGTAGLVAVLGFQDLLWPRLGNGALLLLTLSSLLLAMGFHWHAQKTTPRPIPGTGWLRSFGCLSYEIYLVHMFVVWPVVRAFKATGANLRWGFLWYPPALALSWLLGWLVSKALSLPGERAMRRRLLPNRPGKSAAIGA